MVGGKIAVVSLSLPSNEKTNLFLRMVLDLRDDSTTSKEYGLDLNLSTNIRHGFILRELRGPLVARNLITNKTTELGDYKENSHWLDKDEDDYFDRSKLNDALSAFSRNIDAVIENLTRKIIRIRSTQAPEGLFNYEFSSVEIQLVQRSVGFTISYEEFLAKFSHTYGKELKFV